jgi:hypothetical protein
MNSRRVNAKVQPISIEVPRDRWVEFLGASGFHDKVVLELAIPEFAPVNFREAVHQLQRAQEHLLEARFEQCMSECRLVWEAVRPELEDDKTSAKLRALLVHRVGEVRARAYMSILSQTKQLASAPVHLHGARAPALRSEAHVLLTCTASLLALVTELAPEAVRPAHSSAQLTQSAP